jgi:hypothetical protein
MMEHPLLTYFPMLLGLSVGLLIFRSVWEYTKAEARPPESPPRGGLTKSRR